MVIINPKLVNLIQCWRIPKVFNHSVQKKRFLKDLFLKKNDCTKSLIWSQPQNLLLWPVPNPKSDPTCDVAIMAIPRRQGQLRKQLLRVTVSPRRRQASMGYVAMDASPAKKWGDHGMHGDSTNHVNQFFGDVTEHPRSGFPY